MAWRSVRWVLPNRHVPRSASIVTSTAKLVPSRVSPVWRASSSMSSVMRPSASTEVTRARVVDIALARGSGGIERGLEQRTVDGVEAAIDVQTVRVIPPLPQPGPLDIGIGRLRVRLLIGFDRAGRRHHAHRLGGRHEGAEVGHGGVGVGSGDPHGAVHEPGRDASLTGGIGQGW